MVSVLVLCHAIEFPLRLLSGNFHALILFKDDEELQKVSEAVHRLVHRAVALDGTCG